MRAQYLLPAPPPLKGYVFKVSMKATRCNLQNYPLQWAPSTLRGLSDKPT